MGLDEVTAGIARACGRTGRDPAGVTLVAVSKVQPEERVRAVLRAGHRVFGENRVQEAEGRWTPLRGEFPDVRLHLVGPLQTNKARAAMGFFDAIHTVDRPKLARTLARLRDEGERCPDLFVQVNTGEEPQKAGVAPAEADALVAECRSLALPLVGLMCIPPAEEEPSPHFALLRKIAERNGLSGLSMGMSGDYDAAIGQGATHVRVGSAVFGAREA
ncbi:hypothetical protein BCF33_1634 [Hasllibacter halocynthiae]|uniref:Pyridoxal phosphate homeostasis protein n=1 Tax=Hasllibacter halocynthiae TaxID=595589 RepID=A0A2T0X1H2_9RHOB|nr:YggS family pyridoxal phosphate-dependent enzyme [Hasllibacter halocynthiae]PRY92780.1 hypothetical protein BCF33_1634 [Hasllibacter halocynthiae]